MIPAAYTVWAWAELEARRWLGVTQESPNGG